MLFFKQFNGLGTKPSRTLRSHTYCEATQGPVGPPNLGIIISKYAATNNEQPLFLFPCPLNNLVSTLRQDRT